jgi:hypothetical protein
MVICFHIPSLLNRWKHFFKPGAKCVWGSWCLADGYIYNWSHYCQNPGFLKWKLLLKSYKSVGTDQIPTELIKAGSETLHSEINSFILYGIRRNCHNSGRNLLLYQFVRTVTDCKYNQGISMLSTAYKILSNILLARLMPYVSEITGDNQCGFNHNLILIRFSTFTRLSRKNGSTVEQCIIYL